MPQPTYDATAAAQDGMGQHLTGSILTLQQTIRNIRQDVANGIAPSLLMPSDADQGMDDGMFYLSLEPSTRTIESHIGPLDERLLVLEREVRARGQWHTPSNPPKSPEYSIIDTSDLTSAIEFLEEIFKDLHTGKPLSTHSSFSKHC